MGVQRWLAFAAALAAAAAPALAAGPRLVGYSASPGRYLDEHAADVARIYDGLIFVVGSWEGDVTRRLSVASEPPPTDNWLSVVRSNVRALRAAGATESLLGVHFGESEAWPSPDTLLSDAFTDRIARHFAAVGRAAREAGMRGVCIDIEYPFKRYQLDHPVYTYAGYTAEDLVAAARKQARVAVGAVLDAFPDAVVWTLPGDVASARPIGRAFLLGMLSAMAERDAPGGFHFGTERAYSLFDPASQVAIPRFIDCALDVRADARSLEYWKRRGTVAPGVWPLHMAEGDPKLYPVRPWPAELAELRQQYQTLRSLAKRYMWSYSGTPVWGPSTLADFERYGMGRPALTGLEEAITGWQAILREPGVPTEPRIRRLIREVRRYDARKLDAAGLCAAFGTPCDWLILGPLGNPNELPQFGARSAADGPVAAGEAHHGRDGLVRWFPWRNADPGGQVVLADAFDHRNTDACSVVLACDVIADREVTGYLWFNWDDGAVVRMGGKVILDHAAYPKKGHGMIYRDRYVFEDRVPVTIPRGRTRLSITSLNSHGLWGVAVRFADADTVPLEGLRFELPRVR